MTQRDPTEARLTRNLRCLALRDPALARRLCEPVGDDHVELKDAGSGIVTARFKQVPERWIQCPQDPRAAAAAAVASWDPAADGAVLCLGVGLGYELSALLKRLPPERKILGYERDPWLLRQALCWHDFSRDLVTGRLSFLLGTDLAALATPSCLFLHPYLGPVYESERRYLRAKKPGGQGPRAMVAAGGLFVEDVQDALIGHGFDVLTWDPHRVSREESLHQLKSFGPELVVAINYLVGLPELCRELGIRCAIWEIDPSIERLPDVSRNNSETRIYTYRKEHVGRFRRAGFTQVEYLPLAANPRRRFPMELSEGAEQDGGAAVSFMGNSMDGQAQVLKGVFSDVCRYHRIPDPERHWQEALLAQQMEPDRDVVRQTLAGSMDRPLVLNDGQGRLVDVAACVAETAASRRRFDLVRALTGQGVAVDVWGDEGWLCCPGVNYRGWAGHDRQLTSIYNASAINLDINRLYQNDIVTMRVFDVLACKGFLLADCSTDVADLFDLGRELVVYRSRDELLRLVDHYLGNDRERAEIAAAGYARVLKDHTMDRRIGWILADREAMP